jgi:hypothetical protein
MNDSLKEKIKGKPISGESQIPRDLVIDETNFDQYFHDARTHKPEPGQVMAKYSAVAYLEDGNLKRDLIALLQKQGKAEAATRVMQVLGGATHKDAVRVPMEMANDLLSGMSENAVAQKPYRYVFEHIYWAERGVVPDNDPHWYKIPILNWAKQFDAECDRLGLKDEDFEDDFLPAKEDADLILPGNPDVVE